MRPLLFVVALLAVGCGSEIGDSCSIYLDCAQDGTRLCDSNSDGGYCTIRGCDFGTCPSESVCVRFFTGSFDNKTCDPKTEDDSTDMCNPDELCALDGHCVTRASEVRYCMRSCEQAGSIDNRNPAGDCRDGYECRGLDLMKDDGGEPVPASGTKLPDQPQAFCAQAPTVVTGS